METERQFAYLHGFGSGPTSRKGLALAAAFDRLGVHLARPDLNRPGFSRLTVSGGLAAIDELAATGPALALVGSSLGGYQAALWASLNPGRVARLVLLCPGFDLCARWPAMLGAAKLARWRAHGWLPFADADGAQTPVHWGFIEDALAHPPVPVVPCPTLILHGVHDEVVPIDTSRAYAAAHPSVVRLVEVDDDHLLARSHGIIEAETLAFFGLGG